MLNDAPPMRKAKLLRRYRVGEYDALLLGHIKADGPVKYLYILGMFRRADHDLCLGVASEENKLSSRLGGGSHFLGVFPGEGHENHGASDEWANVETFGRRALQLARERLGIGEEAEELPLPKPWWRFW